MTAEIETFERFTCSSIDHLVYCLEGLSETELNWWPAAPETNGLYAITMHVLGNAEENILGTLCGHPVHRNREQEFASSGASSGPCWSAGAT